MLLSSSNTHESGRRLVSDIKSDSSLGGGFEVLVAEGEMDVEKGKFNMKSESLCALVAMKPNALKAETTEKLKEACSTGKLPVESAVWLNAFMGRVYRDASTSFKFQNHFQELMSRIMNKGKKVSATESRRRSPVTVSLTHCFAHRSPDTWEALK